MEGLLAATAASRRFALILFEAFGFGRARACGGRHLRVLSGSVAERTREIGIRIALGAQRRNVFGPFVGQGLRLPTLIGVAVAARRSFRRDAPDGELALRCQRDGPGDVLSLAALLTTVALLASYIPARRATKVDPLVALRYE